MGHRRDEQLVLLGGVVHRLADDGQDQGGEVDFEVAKGEPRVAEKTEIRRSRHYASRMQTPQRVRVSQGPDDAIRVIAAAVIRDGDRILVWHDHDPATGEVVAVPLAGGIEFGETGEEAIRRELKEEIGSGPKSVRYLGLFEDIFEWAGRKRHELFLIYDVELADRALYATDEVEVTESDGSAYLAYWRPLTDFVASTRLVPDGLMDLIAPSRT